MPRRPNVRRSNEGRRQDDTSRTAPRQDTDRRRTGSREQTLSLERQIRQKLPQLDGVQPALRLIAEPTDIDVRYQVVQQKLAGVGVEDVSKEGSLVLGGSIVVTPGVQRGVANLPDISLQRKLDLDALPQLLDYTRGGRTRPIPEVQSRVSGVTARRSVGRVHGRARKAMPVSTQRQVSSATARTLKMAPAPTLPVDEAIIVADTLQLQDGLTMLIDSYVRYLTIIVSRIIVGDGVVITWEAEPVPVRDPMSDAADGTPDYNPSTQTAASDFTSPDGGDASDGVTGATGYPGEAAPTVEIWCLDLNRLPAMELQGQQGGTGQRGQDGGDGGDGAMGLNAHQNLVNCTRGPGHGGDGGDGGDGGSGGRGGTGGRGADLLLYTLESSHQAVLAAGFPINLAGGAGGSGGTGGQGGRAGRGGDEGERAWPWCVARPERAGRDGRAGSDGSTGAVGNSGETGEFTAGVITVEQFRQKFTSPQIARFNPEVVQVGDTVTVHGGNFTRSCDVTFAGTPSATTVVSDTMLQADVPPVQPGWVEVRVTDASSGKVSNPAFIKVIPSLASITPSPAFLGATVQLTGSGFDPACRVLFRGLELVPNFVDPAGISLSVTLSAPGGPFEDFGGEELISVRNPDGTGSNALSLPLRHILTTGFDVTRHAFSFPNHANLINGVANWGTFEDTYGAGEVYAAVGSTIVNALTGNWVSAAISATAVGAWFGFYLHFFNNIEPGYSSGFSILAADEYWSGNPNLHGDYTTMSRDIERELTIAQGHILSEEMLMFLMDQANGGVAQAEASLDMVEATFRAQITANDAERRRIAPIMQLIPAGNILTPGFINNLNVSHGLLPIRIEYPMPGEAFERRLVIYDNAFTLGAAVSESTIDFTRNGGVLDFTIFDPNGLADARGSQSGWTLSAGTLEQNWLVDVDMPTDFLLLLSPAEFLVEDAQGRRFGKRGKEIWNDIPGAMPALGVKGLFLVPLEDDVDITITGTGSGEYQLLAVSGSNGRAVTLANVPVSKTTTDRLSLRARATEITFGTNEREKQVSFSYGVRGFADVRAIACRNLSVSRGKPFRLTSAPDLSEFSLESSSRDSRVDFEAMSFDAEEVSRVTREGYSLRAEAVERFEVTEWKKLTDRSFRRRG